MTLAAAGAYVSLISSLAELGAAYGAAWGINTGSTIDTVLSYGAAVPSYAPAAEALRLMAEVLPGMTLIDDPGLDQTRWQTDVFRYAYVDRTKAVVFLVADDLPADRETVLLNLSGFGTVTSVTLDRLTASEGLYGTPILTHETLAVSGATISVPLRQDHEVSASSPPGRAIPPQPAATERTVPKC